MAKTSTFTSKIRSRLGNPNHATSTPVPTLHSAIVSFNPSVSATAVRVGWSATSGEFLWIPKNGVLVSWHPIVVSATGSSTQDMGYIDTAGAFTLLINEMSATAVTITNLSNSLAVTGTGFFAAPVKLAFRAGANAAASATSTAIITYTVEDDGKAENSL